MVVPHSVVSGIPEHLNRQFGVIKHFKVKFGIYTYQVRLRYRGIAAKEDNYSLTYSPPEHSHSR